MRPWNFNTVVAKFNRYWRTCLQCRVPPDEMDEYGCDCPRFQIYRYAHTGSFARKPKA